ncbi:MAG TPA: hypothetical protein VFQ41_15890 [Candidatus Angelobacter sp.]|nr:hypothetical protein [Candidatus Angelobacter sp.]
MARITGILFVSTVLIAAIGCGGGSSTPAPTPTPTPGQIFPNDTASAQSAPVKLGTSGGSDTDIGATVCCIGTLGSLWTHVGTTNPVILSNNHVLDKSGTGTPGDAVIQPLQAVCRAGHPTPLTVANLTQAAALKPAANETTGPCQGNTTPLCGHAPSNVDAAYAAIVAGEVDTSGTILDLGPVGATSIAAAPPSSTLGVPSLGEAVSKSGRTTGLTCSNIQSLNLTILVNYDGVCGAASPAFTAYFTNQVTISGGTFSAGGDSGSLVVDTGTSRAVGLLYGGNSTSTVANPIQDVINAFGGPAVFSIVGGADHAVSCAHTATASAAQVGTTQAALIPKEQERVAAVQQRRAAQLMQDPSIKSVTVGASADNPSEGALLIQVSGSTIPRVPPSIDGVRTRLVFEDTANPRFSIGAQEIDRATIVKEAHVGSLMGQPGIQGVGVSISADNPAETAVSIYVVKGVAHAPIPAVIDGVRTRIFEGDRFRAY